jgi:hypothetical protein
MKLAAAQSLVAWLWDQHPEIVYALEQRVPGQIGQCFSCDLDLLTGSSSCDNSLFSSLSCSSIATDAGSLDPGDLGASIDANGLDSGLDSLPTLTADDLTPVDTSAVTGSCVSASVTCSLSSAGSAASTANGLSGVANFLTSGTGLEALASVATAYFKAQAAASTAAAAEAAIQAKVVASQTARAVTGQTSLPIQYVANGATGTTTPVVSTVAGNVPLTNSILAAFTPSSIEVWIAQYGTWVLIGGAAAFLTYAATRRKRSP